MDNWSAIAPMLIGFPGRPGRHLGGIATASTPGGGDDESGFRSQPESGRISPITGSRQSLIFWAAFPDNERRLMHYCG
jgi:hypothetical protein